MRRRKNAVILALWMAAMVLVSANTVVAQQSSGNTSSSSEISPTRFPGMDQSVNVELAAKAGAPARRPYIDVERWGDLWNFILLFGGAVSGFVVGRRWDQIWGRPR